MGGVGDGAKNIYGVVGCSLGSCRLCNRSACVMKIPDDDLKVSAIRQGQAGGQQVGLTRYTVRIEHLPTGIAAESGTERSQLHNRRIAMEMVEYGLMAAGMTTPANKTRDGE